MHLAVLSDIHSNYIGLQACIKYLESQDIDGVILLGDYVSDCPKPQKTLREVKRLINNYPSWVIKGNREEYFLNYRDGKEDNWEYSSYKGSLLYTYEHLTKEDLEWFEQLPSTMIVDIKGTKPITIVHGSPVCAKELMDKNQENTDAHMKACKTDYILAGHTHRQFSYYYENKLLINPGSIGVAIGARATAHMAILYWEEAQWKYRLIGVPYSYAKLKKEFESSSLMEQANVWPKCILKSVESGVNVGPICAKKAYDLAIANQEEINDRIVPEYYWKQAAKELGVI